MTAGKIILFHPSMKKGVSLLFAIGIIFMSNAQQARAFYVINPSPVERKDELVTLSKAFLAAKTGKLGRGQYVQIKRNGRPLVVQYDDLDGDGVWDEAGFVYSFAPKENVVFTPVIADKPATVKAVVRAHVRQRHKLPDESFAPSVIRDTMPYNNQPTDFNKQKLPPYLTEGPGWENDKVGFRKYFDVRNANDIWGKVTSRMMLDEVGVDPTKIYHHFDSTWGMDILKVGKSLGAGGLALLTKINGKDTVIRFGRNVGKEIYEQVADGPVRALFRIHYNNWKIDGLAQPISATEEISIQGGTFYYENKVTIKGAPSGSRLAIGVIDFYTPTYDSFKTSSVAGLLTWDKQSENGDNLGLAILTNQKYYAGSTRISTGEVSNTFALIQNLKLTKPLIHRLFVGWEKTNPQFINSEGFTRMLHAEAKRIENPIIIQ